jgi:hypothetical protein
MLVRLSPFWSLSALLLGAGIIAVIFSVPQIAVFGIVSS